MARMVDPLRLQGKATDCQEQLGVPSPAAATTATMTPPR
jgi:hypothetical protein